MPPASAESPLAVKMGSKFTMIPTDVRRQSIKEEDEGTHDKKIDKGAKARGRHKFFKRNSVAN